MSRRGWALFVAMAVIWGVPYLLIKVAVGEFSPVVVVFLRCVIGAVLLLPWTLARGSLRTAVRALARAAAVHRAGDDRTLAAALLGRDVAVVLPDRAAGGRRCRSWPR